MILRWLILGSYLESRLCSCMGEIVLRFDFLKVIIFFLNYNEKNLNLKI